MWVVQSWIVYIHIVLWIMQITTVVIIIIKFKQIMVQFPELKAYIAKNIVTEDEVQGVVNAGVAIAVAPIASQITGLSDLVSQLDTENDAVAQQIAEYVAQLGVKVNELGAIVGDEVTTTQVVEDSTTTVEPTTEETTTIAPEETTTEETTTVEG